MSYDTRKQREDTISWNSVKSRNPINTLTAPQMIKELQRAWSEDTKGLSHFLQTYHILSDNTKTGVSINFPVSLTCRPTSTCSGICYACKGRMVMTLSMQRAMWNYKLFRKLETKVIAEQIAQEFMKVLKRNPKAILRWNGVGDLFNESVKVINYLGEHYPNIDQLIYSRKPEMINKIKELPSIHVCMSFDKSSEARLKKLKRPVKLTYLRDSDELPTVKPDIIFPIKQKEKSIPIHAADCPCDRKLIPLKDACVSCRRCL